MGADGGISWLVMNDVKDHDRIAELLVPLKACVCGDIRDETWEWLKENDPGPKAWLIPYGTDMEDYPDAREISSAIADELDEPRDTTFEEIAIDLATRPSWQLYQTSEVERLVFFACTHMSLHNALTYSWFEKRRTQEIIDYLDDLGAIRNMSLFDWAKELSTKLDWKNYHIVETWT